MSVNDPEPESKPKRTKLNHVQLDVDFFTKPKIIALEARFGEVALLGYVKLLCAFGNATDARILAVDVIDILNAFGLSNDQSVDLLQYLKDRGMITLEGDHFTHTRISSEQESLHISRQKYLDRQQRYNKKRENNGHNDEREQNNDASLSVVTTVIPINTQHSTLNTQDLGSKDLDTYVVPLPEQTNGIHKKAPKLFNPEGKTKFMDWVYLSDDQLNRVESYYKSKGLEPNDLKEAIRELDRWFHDNPKKRLTRTDDAKALMGWPLDQAIKRKQELLRLNKQQARP